MKEAYKKAIGTEEENILNEIITEGAKLAAKQSYIRKGLKQLIDKINGIIPDGVHIPYTVYDFIDEDEDSYGRAWLINDTSVRLVKYSTWNETIESDVTIDKADIKEVRLAAEALPKALKKARDRIKEVKTRTEHAAQLIDSMLEAIE